MNEEGEAAAGLPAGVGRRIRSQKRANERLAVIIPLTLLVIFLILYTMFRLLEVGAA